MLKKVDVGMIIIVGLVNLNNLLQLTETCKAFEQSNLMTCNLLCLERLF